MEWNLQKKVITDLMSFLKPDGKLLMFEGSKEGTGELNKLRAILKLPPIPIKWHNLFFNDKQLTDFILNQDFQIVDVLGLGEYFF